MIDYIWREFLQILTIFISEIDFYQDIQTIRHSNETDERKYENKKIFLFPSHDICYHIEI